MKVTEIQVQGGYTITHPYESYSNLRCDVTVRAVVEEGEDATTVLHNARVLVRANLETEKGVTLDHLQREHECRFADPAIEDDDGELEVQP